MKHFYPIYIFSKKHSIKKYSSLLIILTIIFSLLANAYFGLSYIVIMTTAFFVGVFIGPLFLSVFCSFLYTVETEKKYQHINLDENDYRKTFKAKLSTYSFTKLDQESAEKRIDKIITSYTMIIFLFLLSCLDYYFNVNKSLGIFSYIQIAEDFFAQMFFSSFFSIILFIKICVYKFQ